MKNFIGPLLITLALLAFSCNKDENLSDAKVTYNISGSIQKGPFINGSDIFIYELDYGYRQTGNSFTANTGRQGQFELSGISLYSPYIEVIGDGFYFNEISGSLSNERISLKAIMDLREKDHMNVNILTHLEYERVKYLVAQGDYSIQEAKVQAQNEILQVFSLDDYTVGNSEELDISHSGEGDAILLAISAIMQGNRTTAELSMLMADFISDMKEDGILNDTLIQADLLGQARALGCNKIRENVIERYHEIGVDLNEVNDFEDYINHFITHSGFDSSSPFEFPSSTSNGINVLNPENLEFLINTWYSFAVDMPGAGEITVKMHLIEGDIPWGYQPFETYGWNVSQFNFVDNEQIFTSTLNDGIIDLPIEFAGGGRAVVEYYYNGSEIPAMTKTITIGAPNLTEFIFPNDSPMGPNLLNMPEGTEIVADTSYTVGLRKSGNWDIDFTLTYSEGVEVSVNTGWGIYDFEESEGQIDFTLTGTNEGDYISEIVFEIHGEGEINLVSDDLEIEEGTFLDRVIYKNSLEYD